MGETSIGVKNVSAAPRLRLRVLVIEDELLIRWSIAQTLARMGHTVIEADDAASAVRTLEEMTEPADVILLDYRLPDSNNLNLLAPIRRLAPHSAVVMMTAYGTPDLTWGAIPFGVYGVLDKPFDMQDLEPILLDAYAASQ